MNASKLFTLLPATVLGIVLGVCITPAFSVDGDPPGLFELDGDPQGSSEPGDDWETLYLGGGSAMVFTGIINDEPWDHDADPNTGLMDTSVFTGGQTKDINDFSAWLYKYGEPLDKGEITNAYAAAYLNPSDVCLDGGGLPIDCDDAEATQPPVHYENDLIIYFGLDRYANNGDAFAGFWFIQNVMGLEPFVKTSAGFIDEDGNPAAHVAKTGTTPGDLLVLVEYPQANETPPVVKVYEYDPNDADADGNKDEENHSIHPLDLIYHPDNAVCDGFGGKLACAITNDRIDGVGNDIGAVPAPWEYTPKSGSPGEFPYETFYSGGINVTQLLGSTPCISSFLAETRASASESATLKDFALGSFDVCSIGVTKSCVAEINTAGNAVRVDFSGIVTNTGAIAFDDILLYDDHSNAEITAVCLDGNANGVCGDTGDTDIGTYNSGGSANVVLQAGEAAVYEGYYEVSAPITSLVFNDEVTADAYMDLAVIKSDTASAECEAVGTPGISVNKLCTPYFDTGDTFRAEITGDATNTGNVKLVNVVLSDTVFSSAQLTVVHDANKNGVVDPGEGAFNGTLLPGEMLAYKAQLVSTTSTSHSNTMTVAGENVFNASDTVSDYDMASCGISPAPAISIDKKCDESINGTGVRLVQYDGVVAVEVGNIIEVTNTGNEVLSPVQVSDSEMALITTAPGWSCASGICTGSLGLGESIRFTQTYLPDGLNVENQLNEPANVLFKNEATASGAGKLSGASVGPVTDDATCKVCPPCDPCE